MGEYADLIINGEVCQMCFKPLEGDPTGFPTFCPECHKEMVVDNQELNEHNNTENSNG